MNNFFKISAIKLIEIYQKTLSPDHGFFKARHPYGYCRFYPSCSEYTKQSVLKYGVGIGLFNGIKRILKCNPWTEPKIDLA